VVLLDYSRTQLRLARQRLGQDQRYLFVAADIYRLPFAPGLFDAATMIRTLHHMADAPAALRQVRQALQPGAAFILEYASKHNLKAILRYFLRRQTWSPFTPEPVEFAALNFDFHPKTVRAWLDQSGFKVERQLTVSHFRIGQLKRTLPTRWLVQMDALAQFTGDWWQLTPSVFVRSTAAGETPLAPAGAFFKCPECGHWPLQEMDAALDCPGCGAKWLVRDGIYDFKENAG
jgi:SAM-dependent methyltransferase